MLKRSAIAVSLAIVIGAPGCDQGPADDIATETDATFTTRDSAGIEIVENRAPEHAPGEFWTFDTVPEIVLGGSADLAALANDSTQLIWEVVGLVRLEDGRVAVLSSMGKQLLLFEPSGELSRTIGRAGEGPGEFRGPEWLQYLPPDTLVVWDYFMTSISHFDTGGNLLSERRVDQGRLREAGASGEAFVFPLPDGSFIVYVSGGPDAEVVESKGWIPRTSTLRTFRSRVGNYARMDDDYTAHVLGPRADITAGGNPPSIYLSSRGRNEIRQFSLDGVLQRIIRRTTEAIPFTERAKQNQMEGYRQWAEAEGSPVPRDIIEQMYADRETHPFIGSLVVDPEGFLWVKEWSNSESGVADQWSVFSSEGRWLGVLPLPWDPVGMDNASCGLTTSALCWVDSDFFLAIRSDELGVERVVGYRIRRDG